jgi:tagatose 1,6-diphosphate aldolase
MKITPGKQKGMKAVSDARGVIAAAAMDQRGSLKSAIAKEKGIDKKDVSAQMLEEFKTTVVRVLTPHASAILLDPEYGLPAAKVRAPNAGLLLAYENSGYDNTRPGRLPDLLDIWSVRRLVAVGADCIKILLYYTPFDSFEINDIKHAWVERIGGECTAADVPFFLEFRRLRRERRRERRRLRAQEAGNRDAQHGRVFEATVWRGRAEGRSSGKHGFCRWV